MAAKKTKGKYGPKVSKNMKPGKGKTCRTDGHESSGHAMSGPCECGYSHDLVQTRWG